MLHSKARTRYSEVSDLQRLVQALRAKVLHHGQDLAGLAQQHGAHLVMWPQTVNSSNQLGIPAILSSLWKGVKGRHFGLCEAPRQQLCLREFQDPLLPHRFWNYRTILLQPPSEEDLYEQSRVA